MHRIHSAIVLINKIAARPEGRLAHHNESTLSDVGGSMHT